MKYTIIRLNISNLNQNFNKSMKNKTFIILSFIIKFIIYLGFIGKFDGLLFYLEKMTQCEYIKSKITKLSQKKENA